jgi:hypothetical protein
MAFVACPSRACCASSDPVLLRGASSLVPRKPTLFLDKYFFCSGSNRSRYVDGQNNGLTAKDPYPWLERSGLAALLAGFLLVLITFFTSYSHVDIPAHASIAVNQQIGIPLLSAALAALVGVDVVFSVGVVKLASNARCADQRD